MPRKYESLADAAERLDISVATLRRWIAGGYLPAYRGPGRILRVDPVEVDAAMRRIPAIRRD